MTARDRLARLIDAATVAFYGPLTSRQLDFEIADAILADGWVRLADADRITQHLPYIDHLIHYTDAHPDNCSCEPEVNHMDEICAINSLLSGVKYAFERKDETDE